MDAFTIDVTYSQVSVFGTRLDRPFNDWTDEHVKQGFSWRPGSVSFATLDDGGPLRVRVSSAPFETSSSRASRVIQVPFEVPEYGEVDVASIGQAVTLELPSGTYALLFEHGRDEHGMWATFHFVRSDLARPEIIRADPEIHPPEALIMTAQPA
ncbi:MAG: hypothetical protein IT372_11625 [Polyangiaceae bacterium]|nr:hypothetical protein [Polyangiaceae bacterium]